GFAKDDSGNVTEIHATYIPESKSGHDTTGLKVKGTIHWVNAPTAHTAEVRLYDRLFKVENPAAEEGDFKSYINEHSLEVLPAVYIEPALAEAQAGQQFQFLRKGYFTVDSKDSSSGKPVFNRTVTLKDSWAKESRKD
ncbi:MAG: glutamine--tRNA ligase, partial [Taibaiella sp.]|nr:glutamine--tRNA ligase [Taibaiella sp.]